jgi:solute carrier family 10 (sodium/bile acid cotransporter), member 7
LAGVVLAATFLPCRGFGSEVFRDLGYVAIGSLFFLQGARLSRDAILNGITNWRLHATIAATTFLVFPLLGTGLGALFPHLLKPALWLGILFVCALPSTVQSSIALTSMAQGNVAGAICSATASNVAGIILTPLIFGAMSRLHGGAVSLQGVGEIVLELLMPFVAGHLLRPWIGAWAGRNRKLLSITDRSSILLVVYTAFSGAVVHGVWHHLPPLMMVQLAALVMLLLTAALLTLKSVTHFFGFEQPDEVAALFCGSQKSLVSGVPIANVLFSGATVGPALLPIMLYYPMQLVVCAWLARRYASASASTAASRVNAPGATTTATPSLLARLTTLSRGRPTTAGM